MNILDPVFERLMVFHSYACRKGKGTHAALQYAFSKCKGHPWFLKLDMRKYFDSIGHEVLKATLARIIKDRKTLAVLGSIIDTYETSPGRGVPIGNLTSQYFANLYLAPLDHFILEKLKPAGFCRYMDDFVLWADAKSELLSMLDEIKSFTENRLRLALKPPVLGRTEIGLPFLGFMVKKRGIYLLGKSKRRMRMRVREIRHEVESGLLDEESAAARIVSVYAAVLLARTRPFRVRLWQGSGFGLEPRQTRRQLEQ
jgi:hypothetical protein